MTDSKLLSFRFSIIYILDVLLESLKIFEYRVDYLTLNSHQSDAFILISSYVLYFPECYSNTDSFIPTFEHL